MTATERRQDMLDFLSFKRHSTTTELCTRYGVSEKTIRRDVEILSAEAPLYTTQGANGGIHLEDKWYSNQRHMSRAQTEFLQSLCSGLQPEQQEMMNEILRTFGNKKVS